MKKKIIVVTLMLLMTCIFFKYNVVKAVSVKSYGESNNADISNACEGGNGNCLGTEGFSAGTIYGWNFSESAVYGVRVTVVDKENNIKGGPVNFWANPNMKNVVDNSNFIDKIEDTIDDYRDVYNLDVGLYINCLKKIDAGLSCTSGEVGYAGYLKGITTDNVEAYLNSIYLNGYDKKEVYNYYLKFEPIYIIKHTYKSNSYFYGGTTKDMLNFEIKYDSTKELDTVIRSVNVVTNFVKTVYVDEQIDDTSFAYYSGESIDKFSNGDLLTKYNDGNGHGLGVGYVKISDYNTNNLSCLRGNLFSDQVFNNSGNGVECSIKFILESQMTLQDKKVISGQLIISNNPLTIGTLTLQCPSSIGQIRYSDYVGDILLGDKKLWLLDVDSMNNVLEYNESTGTYEVSVEYYFPPLYIEYLTGKQCNSLSVGCKTIGYGLTTNFKDNGKKTLKFKVNFNGKEYETTDEDDCSYIATPELVTSPPSGDDKLNIEFRTTSSDNPFSGKNGTGRNKIGKNWKSPAIREAVFQSRNDSYNKLKSEPLYTIKLTSSDILSIREYNKGKSYSSFEGTWENNTYKSEFLRDNKYIKDITIANKSNIEWYKDFSIPRLCGDVNGDGFVDTTDKSNFNLFLTGLDSIEDEWAADVDGDGKTTTTDKIILNDYLAGISELNCRSGA